jgi:O-antigen/teichoic acid export membrane protein
MLKKRIITNTFINSGGKLLSYVIQLVIITFLIKSIGKEAYGVVALSLALASNTNLLEAGFGLSVTKYIAEYHTSGRRDDLLKIVNTNFLVSTVLALSFSCTLLIVNELYLGRIFVIPAELLGDTKALVRLLLCLSIVEFWSASIMRIAEGFQQFMLVRLLEVGKWFLRMCFIIAATMNGTGLVGVGVAYLAAGIIMLIASYIWIFSHANGLIISAHYIDKTSFKLLFGFSIWIFFAKMFSFLAYKVDTIIIGIFLPPVNITLYNIAFKIYEFLRFGFSLLASTLVSVTSELNALREYEKMRSLVKKASKYTLLIMYPILVFAYFHVGYVIKYWMGDGFETSVVLSKLYIISLIFIATISSGAEMMVGLNRIKELVPYAGMASILNFGVSIALIKQLGVSSVVVGTIIGTFLMSLGYLYRICIAFHLTTNELWKTIFLKPVVMLMSLGLIYAVVRNLLIADAIFILACLFILTFMIDKEDRRALLGPLYVRKNGYQRNDRL